MGNKAAQKITVKKERFMEVLRLKNCSIRKLGEAYTEIERTEKTIRRCLDCGKMPPALLDRIAKYLDVHPDFLSGAIDEKTDKIEDDFLRSLSRSFIKAEKYPYLLKAKSDIGYKAYFESILIMNDISIEQFKTLPPEKRVLFRQEMVVAIMRVIAKHFTHDVLGNDLSETLSYCESFVGDNDPFSNFHQLEGIGLSEYDIDILNDDDTVSDFEQQMAEKYGNLEEV